MYISCRLSLLICFQFFWWLVFRISNSHFVIDQSRQCAFCTGTPVPVPDETFLHLFFDCPVTRNWHDSFLSKYIILPAEINRSQRLQLFFLGILPNSTKDNLFLAFSIILFQFCIWEEKLRKKNHPSIPLRIFTLTTSTHCCSATKKFSFLPN